METITFTCKVITPMFLAGADGKTPELRAPSIKGAMRFWWRAFRADLVKSGSYADLKKKEWDRFGGTGETASRSSFSLQVHPIGKRIIRSDESLVPHDKRKGHGNAFGPGQQFRVTIRTFRIEIVDELIALFQLVAVLGGVGKRSRRGMGAYAIEQVELNGQVLENLYPQNVDQLYTLVMKLSSQFIRQGEKIIGVSPENPAYPYIKEIEWGKKNQDILKKISQTTHEIKQQNVPAYEVSLGHASHGRFASPIYVSVVNDNIPVITTLNTIPGREPEKINNALQREFKNKIL